MEKLLRQYNFTPAEIEEFMSNALTIKCTKRTKLLREGETARFIYWVTKGVFRSGYTDKKGNEHTRSFAVPNSSPYLAAYNSFVTQKPSKIFLETLEDGELLSWHYDYIEKLQDSNMKYLKFFKKLLDDLYLVRDTKEMEALTLTPEERYLTFLDTFPDITNRVSQHYIASYIGVSPEALSRIRGRITTKAHSKKP